MLHLEQDSQVSFVINKNLKTYDEVVFKDKNQKDIDLVNYKGKLLILNFFKITVKN